MKKIITSMLLSLVALTLTVGLSAQQRPSDRERSTWMKEMRQYKNEYIAKRLALTDEQKTKFLPLYNQMEEDTRKVQEESDQLYRQTLKKDEKATDLEYEKAAEALYELKGRENDIEMKYFSDFKTILTPKQLFKLKVAERDFTRELMNHRRQRSK